MNKPVVYMGERPISGGIYAPVFSEVPILDIRVLNKRALCECGDENGAINNQILEALETLIAVVGLTAFKHENQRAFLQEAVDQAIAAIQKAKGEI